MIKGFVLEALDKKNVVVMGLGRFGGGVDSAVFAAKYANKVVVTDIAKEAELHEDLKPLRNFDNIVFHLGEHSEQDFADTDVIIVNPAVPQDNRFVQIARENGKLITSQIELFFELCPCRIIGITGSNGKSTTTALTAHLLTAGAVSCNSVWLGGNIGNRPLLRIVDEIGPDDLAVLELSSFQLEQLAQIKKAPDVAVVTNVKAKGIPGVWFVSIFNLDKEKSLFASEEARTFEIEILTLLFPYSPSSRASR